MKRLSRAPRSRAAELYKAAGDVVNRRFVSKEKKAERRAICEICPSWNKTLNMCRECGCQMRVKTSLSSSKCPLDKW